jgi:hypothetical protein
MSADRVAVPPFSCIAEPMASDLCPLRPDAAGDYRVPEQRLLLRNLIRKAEPESACTAAALSMWRPFSWRDEGRTGFCIFSLLGAQHRPLNPAGARSPLMEEAMPYEATWN